MPIALRKSKKRRIIQTPEAKERRKEYKKKMRNPTVKKAVQKRAKLWRKKNKQALKRKRALG